MFLDNPNKVIKDDPDYFYTLYVSSRSECASLKVGQSPAPKLEIIAYGESATMDESLAGLLLPAPTFIHNRLNDKMCNTFKCFCCEGLGIEQYISHINAINSWQCLMNTMGNPSHVVVVKTIKIHAQETV